MHRATYDWHCYKCNRQIPKGSVFSYVRKFWGGCWYCENCGIDAGIVCTSCYGDKQPDEEECRDCAYTDCQEAMED